MLQEGKEKETKVVKVTAGLEALDAQLREIADYLGVSGPPDNPIEGTLTDELLLMIDLLSRRTELIADEVQKLR